MAKHWSSGFLGRCSVCNEGILFDEAFKLTRNGALFCVQCAEDETNIMLYKPRVVYRNWICVNCRTKGSVAVPDCRTSFYCPGCGTCYKL